MRVERAPARGQRTSRQPWKAWGYDGRYLGLYRTKRDAKAAVEVYDRAEQATPPRVLPETEASRDFPL